MNKFLAEFTGTFILVFIGTGAATVNEVDINSVSHVGVSLTFGLVVSSVIYAIGDVSGAHINPAVSVGFWLAGRFPLKELFPYLVAQCSGALVGSLILKLLFPSSLFLGATLPAGTIWQSFILEIILSWVLMFVILGVSSGSREKGVLAGVAIGSVVAFEALFGGPISGASMNPARSLAPAIVSGNLQHLWVYLMAPVLGMAFAGLTSHFIFQEQSSESSSTEE